MMTVSARAQFESLASAKLNVRHIDLRIAAIAKDIGATVVTLNRRDFGRVPGLKIEDWTK
jgi:tRNA(fMet)-specific endonuclease VapC